MLYGIKTREDDRMTYAPYNEVTIGLTWGEGKKFILHEKYDISATKKEFQGISINVTFIEVL